MLYYTPLIQSSIRARKHPRIGCQLVTLFFQVLAFWYSLVGIQRQLDKGNLTI
jgi:hypothetical protein